MGMTIAEKILAAKSGQTKVSPGDLVNAKLDWAMANDVTAPIAIADFRDSGAKNVWDKERVYLFPDHFTPNKDIKSADQVKIMRDFAYEQEITNFYDFGRVGVEHAVMPDHGLVLPGDLGIGADSHTCTGGALCALTTGVGSTDVGAAFITGEAWFKVPQSLKFTFNGKLPKYVTGKDLILRIIGDIGVDGALYASMEIGGEAVKSLSMEGRLSITNMAIEAGGKNAIIAFDETTKAYVESRAKRPYTVYEADADAEYALVKEYDVTKMEPLVAYPPLPSNVKTISEAAKENVKMDQGLHWILHQRTVRGHGPCRRDHQGSQGGQGHAPFGRAGLAGGLPPDDEVRRDGNFLGRGCDDQHPDVRGVSRWSHGCACQG